MKFGIALIVAFLAGSAHAKRGKGSGAHKARELVVATECEQFAKLENTNTQEGKVGMFKTNPFKIIEQKGSTVKFSILQTWTDDSLDWMAVALKGADDMVCDVAEDVKDKSKEYEATCRDGVATVGVFVRDSSFPNMADVTRYVPEACGVSVEDGEKLKHTFFAFSLPCDSADKNFCDLEALCINEEDDTPVDREGGGGYGDPHLKTWTGDVYDFHGACDLILAKSEKFGKGTGIEIQIRTEIRHDWSFIASTAIKIGSDVLEVGSHAAFVMNGVAGEKMTKNTDLQPLGGHAVKYFNYGTRRHKFEIDLGDKQKILIKVYNEFLAVNVEEAEEEDFGDAVGMMGHFHTGKLVGRQGGIIEDKKEFGFDWQVRDTETMLFKEAQGPQYPTVCRMPSPKAIKRRKRRLSESMVSFSDAEKACASWEEEARESCIYDVLSTGDLGLADAGAF